MSREWTTYERRSEIIRILEGRRQETMPNLAVQLGVSIRTIAYDINWGHVGSAQHVNEKIDEIISFLNI